MKNPKTIFQFLSLICLIGGFLLVALPQVNAEPLAQAETPPAVATIAPTLNQNLYSQTATPGLDGEVLHTVLPDQFLYHIVQLYGISLQELLSLNNLTEDSPIYPGDQLIIVKGGEMDLGQGTLTPELILSESTLAPSPTPELALMKAREDNPEPTPTLETGFFQRVFSSNARFLAVGVMALVLFGVVLLIISSRRIQ
ncbi:MAG: LysM peptidoglycan-binding domain-containing protein [Chloroflexi bacterium]|nr:LysM peptidoglycan-binding domain-containing protein [Chloroflexota bacterium]